MLVSFVIPCYQSEKTLDFVVEDIFSAMKLINYRYEIILVDDASLDGTANKIKMLSQKKPQITGVLLAKNMGQHAALMAGLHHAQGDLIICADDDGQTPIVNAIDLIDNIHAGYDVVFADYNKRSTRSIGRRFGTIINRHMAHWLIGKPKELGTSSFIAMKRFVVDEILKYKKPYPYIAGLIFRTTNNITSVKVTQKERLSGKSGYSFKKLLALWVNGFTAFSIKPLRLSVFVGMISACIGFIVGIYTIINKLINPNVMIGYSSLMAAMLFLGGMIMLILGMIGEYIGRIYISINESPQYVIREIIKHGKCDPSPPA